MTKRQKKLVTAAAALALCLGILPAANAMHIMEGYLPGGSCIAWGVICLPFLLAGFFSIRRTLASNRKALVLLAMSGAFIFVISFFEDPFRNRKLFPHDRYRTGSHFIRSFRCKHSGSHCAFVPGILLAHGGLTTLGANTFSMAVAGPILSWLIYTICKKLKINRVSASFLPLPWVIFSPTVLPAFSWRLLSVPAGRIPHIAL